MHIMNKDEFLELLEIKVKEATKDWPEWKHNVLRNSFRQENTTPRKIVLIERKK